MLVRFIRSLVCCLLVMALGFLSACDPASEVVQPELTITADRDFTLKGGGWWLSDARDTIVAYATDMEFTVETTRDKDALLPLNLELGAIVDGEFTTDPKYVIIDTATLNEINRQRLVIGGSRKRESFPVKHFAMGRPRSASWDYPYAWRIRYNDGSQQITKMGTFRDCVQINRWHGIVATLENSPDSVGSFDNYVGGDWLSGGLIVRSGAYPNPSSYPGQLDLMIGIARDPDSVVIDYQRSAHEAERLFTEKLSDGYWGFSIEANERLRGLGRIRIRVYSGGEMAEAQGNIYFQTD